MPLWLVLAVLAAAACGRVGYDDLGSATLSDATPDSVADAASDANPNTDAGEVPVTSLGQAKSLAVGSRNDACAVLDNGSLWCWGDRRYGGIPATGTEPFSLAVRIGDGTDWREVVLGSGHGCGIREPGTLWCWGDNGSGEVGNGTTAPAVAPVQVGSQDSWQAVAVGYDHSCALDAADTVWCWGDNQYGQLGDNTIVDKSEPQAVAGQTSVAQLSTGGNFTCTIDATGTGSCWGYNGTGCLGDGTTVDSWVPVQITGTTWKSLDGNYENTVGIAGDGTLWMWGNAVSAPPKQIDTRTDWVEISATIYGACATRANGELWCRGSNNYGVTGPELPLSNSNSTFGAIDPNARFDTIAVTNSFACANRDGRIECIGSGSYGQLGDRSERFARGLWQVPGVWAQVSAGANATCAANTNGDASCWGYSPGFPADNYPQVPTQMNMPTVTAIAQGGNYGIAITDTGALWHWGHLKGPVMTIVIPEPTVLDSSAWTPAIGVRERAGGAVLGDGSLWMWGKNDSGELGDGTTTSREAPTMIGTGYKSVSLGANYSCAIRSADDTLRCWGNNDQGQLGDGTINSSLTPALSASGSWTAVATGVAATLAIRADGTLWGWGTNSYGRLGLGATPNAATPTQVGVDTWLAVDTYSQTSCAIRADRSLWCWGDNDSGQLGDGTVGSSTLSDPITTPLQIGTKTDWAEVAVGDAHGCARSLGNELWCWGDNLRGQRGDGLARRASYGPVAGP